MAPQHAADALLEPAELRRYADAITKGSLGIAKGDVLLVQGGCAHRELVVAVAEAAYRAGAEIVDVSYYDSLVERARLEHGSKAALGVVTP
jgi:aminopeptidase